jgi:hypothetical protein
MGDLGVNARSNHHPTASLEPPSAHRGGNGRLLRWAVNSWLVFHLAAIIIAPASVAPSSELIQSGWGLFRPYLELLYLNHGYHFFAPEPGESSLLAYDVERPDGTVLHGRIPNRGIVPRLLYHRHFMLTEHMRDAGEDIEQDWITSYAEHLCHKYGAARVKLTGQIHSLPTMEKVRAGARLDDPASFEDLGSRVFECSHQQGRSGDN